MGCDQSCFSFESDIKNDINDKRVNCQFCGKPVFKDLYNAHLLMCKSRENSFWCSDVGSVNRNQQVFKNNADEMTMCVKCGIIISVGKLKHHLGTCEPIPCPTCGELSIPRLVRFCPKDLIDKVCENHPLTPPGSTSRNRSVLQIQNLWKFLKLRAIIEETIYRLIMRDMDPQTEALALTGVRCENLRTPQVGVLSKETSGGFSTTSDSTSNISPSIGIPICGDQIYRMIENFKRGVPLPYECARRIFSEAKDMLTELPNIVHICPLDGARRTHGRMKQGSKVVIIGDLHGQLPDLLHILEKEGLPGEGTYYIVNGDFVDRGPQGIEILLLIFSLFIYSPQHVALNRGNHECDYMNAYYKFDAEVGSKYDRAMLYLIQRCFCALPLAAVVNRKIFVVHGGLTRDPNMTLDDIQQIMRFRQIPSTSTEKQDYIFQDLLWSDPVTNEGYSKTERGAGIAFGPDITKKFLERNSLSLIIRSHQLCNGYEEHHDGKVITVFSASNYNKVHDNKGSYLLLLGDTPVPNIYRLDSEDSGFDSKDSVAALDFDSCAHLAIPIREPGGLMYWIKKRTKAFVMMTIRELVFERRHQLLAYFTTQDRTFKGSLWMTEWAEAMRNVLNIDIPWFYVHQYLVQGDCHMRIHYLKFLENINTNIMELWLPQWVDHTGYSLRTIIQEAPAFREGFCRERVTYIDFCSLVRKMKSSMADAELFQLFVATCTPNGYIHGPQFLTHLEHHPQSSIPQWTFGAMHILHRVFTQGQLQLSSIFSVNPKSGQVKKKSFFEGMGILNEKLNQRISIPQLEAIYKFLATNNQESITFDQLICSFILLDRKRYNQARSYPALLAKISGFFFVVDDWL